MITYKLLDTTYTRNTTLSNAQYHFVKQGETLYSISKLYVMTIENLKTLNNLQSNSVSEGQKLFIKLLDKLLETPKEVLKIHTVKAGETLYSISKKYKISVKDIKLYNNLTSDSIALGQVLKLQKG